MPEGLSSRLVSPEELFHPATHGVERAAGLARDDTLQAKLDRLDAVLAQTSTSIQDVALIPEMLSLPNDGRYPALELTPEQRRERTLEALMAQMQALARSRMRIGPTRRVWKCLVGLWTGFAPFVCC
jgi:predicted ATPase